MLTTTRNLDRVRVASPRRTIINVNAAGTIRTTYALRDDRLGFHDLLHGDWIHSFPRPLKGCPAIACNGQWKPPQRWSRPWRIVDMTAAQDLRANPITRCAG